MRSSPSQMPSDGSTTSSTCQACSSKCKPSSSSQSSQMRTLMPLVHQRVSSRSRQRLWLPRKLRQRRQLVATMPMLPVRTNRKSKRLKTQLVLLQHLVVTRKRASSNQRSKSRSSSLQSQRLQLLRLLTCLKSPRWTSVLARSLKYGSMRTVRNSTAKKSILETERSGRLPQACNSSSPLSA